VGLALRLFGVPGIRLDERELSIGLSGKALALLAYLALAAPALVSRGKLAGLLWPDKAEEAAGYRLRHTLWELRRSLGVNGTDQESAWLGANDTHCWLDPNAGIAVDVLTFAHGVAEAAPDPARLAAAVALYRGDLLDGLNLRDAPLFDEWLLVERERWQLAYLDALWRLARLQQAAADDAEAERTFHRLIAADPLRERSYRGMMGLHHRRGERAAALRIYQQCVRTLDAEMGITPSAVSEQLRRLISQETPAVTASELARAAELLRCGRHVEAWAVCQAAESLRHRSGHPQPGRALARRNRARRWPARGVAGSDPRGAADPLRLVCARTAVNPPSPLARPWGSRSHGGRPRPHDAAALAFRPDDPEPLPPAIV
jgi:DNA-binding SARP family transcriptional activator